MKVKMIIILAAVMIMECAAAGAEVRTYRQFKDVATKENGKVAQSTNKADLFEFTYMVDRKNGTITRTQARRLDQKEARKNRIIYNITKEEKILGSEAGMGGDVMVAVQKGGGEILVMGRRFAFTSRISPFSQLITGVYKRVYIAGDEKREYKHEKKK